MDARRTAPSHPMTGMDAFAPAEIASLVESRGIAKADWTLSNPGHEGH